MPSEIGKTIDAINVEVGVNFPRLDSSMKQASERVNKIATRQFVTFVAQLDEDSFAAAAKKVDAAVAQLATRKLNIKFDLTDASASHLKTVIEKSLANQNIEVPIVPREADLVSFREAIQKAIGGNPIEVPVTVRGGGSGAAGGGAAGATQGAVSGGPAATVGKPSVADQATNTAAVVTVLTGVSRGRQRKTVQVAAAEADKAATGAPVAPPSTASVPLTRTAPTGAPQAQPTPGPYTELDPSAGKQDSRFSNPSLAQQIRKAVDAERNRQGSAKLYASMGIKDADAFETALRGVRVRSFNANTGEIKTSLGPGNAGMTRSLNRWLEEKRKEGLNTGRLMSGPQEAEHGIRGRAAGWFGIPAETPLKRTRRRGIVSEAQAQDEAARASAEAANPGLAATRSAFASGSFENLLGGTSGTDLMLWAAQAAREGRAREEMPELSEEQLQGMRERGMHLPASAGGDVPMPTTPNLQVAGMFASQGRQLLSYMDPTQGRLMRALYAGRSGQANLDRPGRNFRTGAPTPSLQQKYPQIIAAFQALSAISSEARTEEDPLTLERAALEQEARVKANAKMEAKPEVAVTRAIENSLPATEEPSQRTEAAAIRAVQAGRIRRGERIATTRHDPADIMEAALARKPIDIPPEQLAAMEGMSIEQVAALGARAGAGAMSTPRAAAAKERQTRERAAVRSREQHVDLGRPNRLRPGDPGYEIPNQPARAAEMPKGQVAVNRAITEATTVDEAWQRHMEGLGQTAPGVREFANRRPISYLPGLPGPFQFRGAGYGPHKPAGVYAAFNPVLDPFDKPEGHAEGGPVMGPLASRLLAAKLAREQGRKPYIVGEKHDELYIGDSGRAEIVGRNGPEVFVPPEAGRIEPHVPEWIRRMDKNAKAGIPPHRAEGGPVEGPSPRAGYVRIEDMTPEQRAALASKADEAMGISEPAPDDFAERLFSKDRRSSRVRSRRNAIGPLSMVGAPGLATSMGGELAGRERVKVEITKLTPDAKSDMAAAGKLSFEALLKGLAKETPEKRAEVLRNAGLTEAAFEQQEEAHARKPRSTRQAKEPRERVEPIGALASYNAASSAEQTVAQTRETISALRAQAAIAPQEAPVRALSVSVGQIFGNLFGARGQILERQKRAQFFLNEASSATSDYEKALSGLGKTQASIDKEESKGNTTSKTYLDLLTRRKEQTEVVASAEDKMAKSTARATKETEGIISGTTALRSVAATAVGVAVGTELFSAGMQALNVVIAAGTPGIEKYVERATGFRNVTSEITSKLADQTRADKGAVEITIAHADAVSGLSKAVSDSINPLLQQRAQIEAGSKALSDQLDLMHAASTVGQEQAAGAAGQPIGLFQPAGGIPGVTRATGGVLGSPLGATPSLFEQLSGEFGVSNPLEATLTGAGQKGGALNPLADALGGLGDVSRSVEDALSIGPIRIPTAADLFGDTRLGGKPTGPTGPSPEERGKALLDDWKGQLKKVESSFDVVTKPATSAGKAMQEASDKALLLAGVSKDTVDQIDKLGIVFTQNGKAISTYAQVGQLGMDIAKGAATPDYQAVLRQLTTRAIPAQRAGLEASSALARRQIPAQFAMENIASPMMPFGSTFSTAGASKDTLATVSKLTSEFGAGSASAKAITDQIAAGRAEMQKFATEAGHGLDFSVAINQVEVLGKEITGLQTSMSQEQVGLATAEYTNQIRISNRELNDAKDRWAAIQGTVKDTVGGLEGANIQLQRQSQLLGFGLQQRQINFQVALAGFAAPGTTGEERAARIEEAKIEADYAQKQLNYQKQIAQNQYQVTVRQVGPQYALADLSKQLELLQRARQVTIDVAVKQESIVRLQKLSDQATKLAQSYIDQGAKLEQQAIDTATTIAAETGQEFKTVLNATATAWGTFGEQAQKAFGWMFPSQTVGGGQGGGSGWGTPSSATSSGTSGTGGGNRTRAEGYVSTTTKPQTVTYGEAGTETVAIIRNPRPAPSGMFAPHAPSGGAPIYNQNFSLSFPGAIVRNDSDIESIARHVEAILNRRTAMTGFRSIPT